MAGVVKQLAQPVATSACLCSKRLQTDRAQESRPLTPAPYWTQRCRQSYLYSIWAVMSLSAPSLCTSLPGIPRNVLSVPVEPKYLCQECGQVLRKPFQAQCGHRFCVHCLTQLTSSAPHRCQACVEEGLSEDPQSLLDKKSAFPDNAARREIENLPASCSNEGCSWTGVIKEYEASHEGRCELERVQCGACGAQVRRGELERHRERECEERSLNCKYCKVTFSFKNIKAHDEVCVKFPLQCEGCGKKKIPREKYSDHTRSCGRFKTPCQYSAVGCKTVLENEKQSEHEQSSILEHMGQLLSVVRTLREVEDSTVGGTAELETALGLYRAPEDGTPAKTVMAAGCEGLAQKLSALENIVCVLNREAERNALKLEAFTRQHMLDQERIENLNKKMHQMERSMAMKELHLAETEQQLRELEFCTYDGVFVWKISDFSRRRQDAAAGRTPAMFSPAFYSSKYGYKMCLRLYLNGDGTGRGTHLSLFFVVMRGKNDALLKWPFSQKVTLMLLDQNNREHVIDAFRPDVTSSSFQRPISEMNIASGCPLFCPLAKLSGAKSSYLRDDTIFIKAIVDLTGL
ncbi:TNF receptor-associated factor 2 isoform X2 [Amia ocellicauda]|uniref:TNF receptor-associated factor 2 isoform X2 n=1 Tax=Amia ocellicauda TaxID=2972642 RepID=UPI003464A7E8